jgi:formylglycine-generating enzyme required for sulfatase activity
MRAARNRSGIWVILSVAVVLGCSHDDGSPSPGTAYSEETEARFRLLVETEEWTLAEPPRNAQGMLEAVHGRTGLVFVLLPEGSFQMGTPEEEPGHWSAEGPIHTVRLEPLLISRTECTQKAWDRAGGSDKRVWMDPELPIEGVSWDSATRWCGEVGLRLPSEAEWEYACRAGTQGPIYAGTLEVLGRCNVPGLDPIAWYGGNSGLGFSRERGVDSSAWPEKQFPHTMAGTRRVAQKRANPWGLHDMLGNVWEWCRDRWHETYEGAPTDGSAWISGESNLRVARGGSWVRYGLHCRSGHRFFYLPGDEWSNLGFRPAHSLPPPE